MRIQSRLNLNFTIFFLLFIFNSCYQGSNYEIYEDKNIFIKIPNTVTVSIKIPMRDIVIYEFLYQNTTFLGLYIGRNPSIKSNNENIVSTINIDGIEYTQIITQDKFNVSKDVYGKYQDSKISPFIVYSHFWYKKLNGRLKEFADSIIESYKYKRKLEKLPYIRSEIE